jgi:hypothetical protein
MGGIRSNSLLNISRVVTIRPFSAKMITSQGGFRRPFLNYENRKVAMDVKDQQRAVIELLLLEQCVSEEILISPRNVYDLAASYHSSVFKQISEIRRGNKELQIEGRPVRPYRHETDAVTR